MSTHVLIVTGEGSNYEQVQPLDGADYIARLLWNARAGRWFMTLRDSEGSDLITGRKLCAGIPWGVRDNLDGVPPGTIWVVDKQDLNADPGLRDLGDRVHLMYVDEANVG